MFNIHLTAEKVVEPGTGAAAVYGKIEIGSYSETFSASLVKWSQTEYEEHWKRALSRIVEGGKHSALVTSCVEPTPGGFLVWWPLYREGETVYVQNEMLFFDRLTAPLSLDQPWEALRQRQTANDEGIPVSEWTTTVGELRECLDRKRRH